MKTQDDGSIILKAFEIYYEAADEFQEYYNTKENRMVKHEELVGYEIILPDGTIQFMLAKNIAYSNVQYRD